ncbi:CHAD domain-containing protein [Microbacterium atlanticum]|uniref:CHAD domain-containing protein n=1 Tax=Microbacterium atlanticum TaxID=2782168 RepID=UPI0018894814|nr:CHAD domain-containing protein [Microbacterium atlanticum]
MGSRQKDLAIGTVLGDILRRAAAEVEETLPAALADEPDAVHQHRVRVRRLRSVLAGFEDSLDTGQADRLRVAYAEWGSQLGVVRDIEVRASVAAETLEDAGITDPAIIRRLVDSERDAYPAAHARLVELAASPRAQERARTLERFVEAMYVVDHDRPAEPALAEVLRAQVKRVRTAARRLDESTERFHDLRKAARRARYVAEAVADAVPDFAPHTVQAIAEAGDDLHDALGGHRDLTLLAQHARQEGARAAHAGERSEDYEAIAVLAEDAAAELLADVGPAVRQLRAAASDLP